MFTKKDLIDARDRMIDGPGSRRYWINRRQPDMYMVQCNGVKLKSKFIRWWDCYLSWLTPAETWDDRRPIDLFEFRINQPKWNDKWLVEAINKNFQKESVKRRFIDIIFAYER